VLAICVPCMAQTTSAQKAAPKVTNSWPKEPDGFNLAKFGMSAQQINELFTVDGCYPSHTGDRYCGTKLDAGDRFWGIRFDFVNDQLVRITGDFAYDTYQDVRGGFLSKYGPPSRRWNSILRTRMGVQYRQEELLWSGKKVDLLLSKYGDDVDSGFFIFSLTAANARETAKRKEAIQKAIH
jgi:hypothetical protein